MGYLLSTTLSGRRIYREGSICQRKASVGWRVGDAYLTVEERMGGEDNAGVEHNLQGYGMS
jgi:hypothetical protein